MLGVEYDPLTPFDPKDPFNLKNNKWPARTTRPAKTPMPIPATTPAPAMSPNLLETTRFENNIKLDFSNFYNSTREVDPNKFTMYNNYYDKYNGMRPLSYMPLDFFGEKWIPFDFYKTIKTP